MLAERPILLMQTLKEKYNRIIKVVVSAGLGSKKDDKEKMESVHQSLYKIFRQWF